MGEEPPAVRVTVVGHAADRMFTKLNVVVAVRVKVVLVAVTVTAKLPVVAEEHDRVAAWVGGRITLAGLIAEQVRPAGTVVDKETVFVALPPFIVNTEIVALAESPALAAFASLAETAKSGRVLYVKAAVAV